MGSSSGITRCACPSWTPQETNVYDMRLVRHEDGWIYGLFCAERHDDSKPGRSLRRHRPLRHRAHAGTWWTGNACPTSRRSALHQRNCVLHPEFVDGKYAFYTRPMTDFAATGTGDGIGWGLCDDITNAAIEQETIIDPRFYHTIKEGKNGLGPAPIKTEQGLAAPRARRAQHRGRHALRALPVPLRPARSLRSSSKSPAVISWPRKARSAWVMCRTWCSPTAGWRVQNGDVFIYYGSSDTRTHVATSTVDKLLDYVLNTPEDGMRSKICVEQRCRLIEKNIAITALI